MAIDNGMFINWMLSMLLRKTYVPSDFHSRVKAVKEMQEDDVSGLVDVLTDFAVESASVEYAIETGNDNFTAILKRWLETINIDYVGIPTGINPLAEEYFKERWKYSSFPILKLAKWEDIGQGIIAPTKMFFVDGESVYSKEKDNTDHEKLELVNYDYQLGQKDTAEKLNRNVIITRPFGRWYEEYPTPFLVKRGVYHNWQIIKSLKHKETEILDQVIPYMLLIKKGTERLAIDKDISYSDAKLNKVIEQFQTALDSYKDFDAKNKTLTRATNFDEELKHFIPDMKTIFEPELFAVAEKNILSGLGFLDIAEAVSTNRKESILNPTVFIQETKKGVKDFKQVVKELVLLIVEKNKTHNKFVNSDIKVTSSPITAFMTDKFKEKIRQAWDRGKISNKTAIEIIAEVDFETEVKRREKEAKDGIDYTMYPNVTDNKEGISIDLPGDKKTDTDSEDIPDDKTGQEAQEYDLGKKKDDHLEGAPYSTIKDLPSRVKDNLSPGLQSTFMRVFNRAYQTYKNDSLAFRTAWSVIRKIAKKDSSGKWVRKATKVKGKVKKVELTTAMIEEAIKQSEADAIDEAFAMQKLTMDEGKKTLLNKLFGKK